MPSLIPEVHSNVVQSVFTLTLVLLILKVEILLYVLIPLLLCHPSVFIVN